MHFFIIVAALFISVAVAAPIKAPVPAPSPVQESPETNIVARGDCLGLGNDCTQHGRPCLPSECSLNSELKLTVTSLATTVNALMDTLPSNIPTLSASGSNWAIWKLRFEAAVKGKDKWGHFDGADVKPVLTGPNAAAAKDLHTWSKDEATAWHSQPLDLQALQFCCAEDRAF
ncbi:hypothetical protein BDP27DRAFT_1450848 [Rhodocollybia butyracea]|uniref:Uncharacterized protein n=1 Tax=Rhodocollybia butyracea TaxID=206335 RepID=A0A9P5PKF8_9AGAR|nr:hypothetical protein BDP27DRAFT_1450848 [Rhodocollybia butyracea]